MATPAIIDGNAIAAALRNDVAGEVRELRERGITPGLAVILVGDNPASLIYAGRKVRLTREAGMRSIEHRLPTSLKAIC